MSNLPAQHPQLSLHLTDSTLTPLITSSSSPAHLDSLTSLASTALTSHTAISRVNLGAPQRIMVEYPDRGAIVLQTYIDPHLLQQQQQLRQEQPPQSQAASRAPSRPASRPATSSSKLVPRSRPELPLSFSATTTLPDNEDNAPPRLVGVVVAGSADQTREARRAAARLERIGRDLQSEWMRDGIRTDQEDAPA